MLRGSVTFCHPLSPFVTFFTLQVLLPFSQGAGEACLSLRDPSASASPWLRRGRRMRPPNPARVSRRRLRTGRFWGERRGLRADGRRVSCPAGRGIVSAGGGSVEAWRRAGGVGGFAARCQGAGAACLSLRDPSASASPWVRRGRRMRPDRKSVV